MSQPAVVFPAPPPFRRRAFDWWLAQVKHALPPTIFFFVGFNLILLTKRLILQEHDIEFSGFFTATLAALLVGKAVLVTDNLPFMRRFDGAPMIQPILFKSAIYWLCVLFVRFAEGLAHFLASGGAIADFPVYLVEHFSWSRFLSIQIWLMVLFLVYVTLHELNMLFGDGELYRLFFRWRSSEAKLTRRQRIRLLTRLNRLTEANSIEALSERGSAAHAKLVDILHELARPPVALAAQTAQAERSHGLPQLRRGGDVAAPLIEADANLKLLVTHGYLAHSAKDRSRALDAYGPVVPDVKPDTDR